jgi:non-ribosomal peptide synthetase component E (peptide arylation enzyme)
VPIPAELRVRYAEAGLWDDAPLRDGLEAAAQRVPWRVAITDRETSLTYLGAGHNDGAFTPEGWYRTGDLARLAGRRLTVTGRLTEVVARKGLKISLGEVDAVAGSLAGVEEVAGYAVPDEETGERLALALRVRDPDSVEFDQVIHELLGAGLARWKLPEQIVVWESPLPRTASGKIQRRLVAEDAGPRRTMLAPRLRSAAR